LLFGNKFTHTTGNLKSGNAEKLDDRFYSWFKIAMISDDRSVWTTIPQDCQVSGRLRAIGYDRHARMNQGARLNTTQGDQTMLTKMSHPAILILIALAPLGVGQAADMAIDCRLKGGTVVQLPAEACRLEGGAAVNIGAPPASVAVPQPVGGGADQPPVNSKLAAAQKVIVDLLAKPVVETTPLKRRVEGIERTARFDVCRLMVDENLHIEHGNLYSVWKEFKIRSVIDFQKIDREEFGILGKISSKGGDLSATAVYFEERKRKEGNNISISVLEQRNDGYAKYSSPGPGAYWDAPRDDLLIIDEYGYPKDNGWSNVATDKIRILLIVNSSDDAEKLKQALEDIHAMCKPQQADKN
jgi:hypothetical protein